MYRKIVPIKNNNKFIHQKSMENFFLRIEREKIQLINYLRKKKNLIDLIYIFMEPQINELQLQFCESRCSYLRTPKKRSVKWSSTGRYDFDDYYLFIRVFFYYFFLHLQSSFLSLLLAKVQGQIP